ncbi:MAG TPA: hypothetical protein V6C97_34225 [Oculatellaceae cyanobacterium]
MHTVKRVFSSALVAMSVGVLPVFADSVETTETISFNGAKYAQRVKDLGEQIQLVQSKGLITNDEATKFLERQSKLKTTEEEVRKGGFQKPQADELEKSITLLNADVFKASHKSNPIKPGQADKEVNDPNLIPAYPDANLQPGSGVVDKK